MKKNNSFVVWMGQEGLWHWRLIGTPAAAAKFAVKGTAEAEEDAVRAARQSASGAFARINRQRKAEGRPLFCRPAKKTSMAPEIPYLF